MAPSEMSFDTYWPLWPDDKASSTLVLVEADCDASRLCQHFFGMQAAFQVILVARVCSEVSGVVENIVNATCSGILECMISYLPLIQN